MAFAKQIWGPGIAAKKVELSSLCQLAANADEVAPITDAWRAAWPWKRDDPEFGYWVVSGIFHCVECHTIQMVLGVYGEELVRCSCGKAYKVSMPEIQEIDEGDR